MSELMRDLTDAELALIESPLVGVDATASQIICAYEKGVVEEMTPEQLARVMAERQKLGRPLDQDDLLRILGAKGGNDANR